jgi:predicted thioesterase
MAEYEIGATRADEVEVGEANVIKFLGPDGPRVLSTPQMILFMERTSRNLILSMLDEGFDTVGTHVNVYHRAGAPLGSTVRFTSELTAINGWRAEFRVEARMGDKIIGDGTHQRAIISIREFKAKVSNS